MKRKILVTVVIICIVAIAVGWYVFQPKEEEKLFVGAYVEYEVGGMMYGKTLSGTVKLEVVEITEETYTVHIKYDLTLGGEPYEQIRPEPIVPNRANLKWIREHAIPFETADPIPEHEDLMPLKEKIGERRIVALGEGTHGTSEFFKMKHRIVKFLAEEMGFTVFAIEANMPEARLVNRYVLTGEGDPKKALSGLYPQRAENFQIGQLGERFLEFGGGSYKAIDFTGIQGRKSFGDFFVTLGAWLVADVHAGGAVSIGYFLDRLT